MSLETDSRDGVAPKRRPATRRIRIAIGIGVVVGWIFLFGAARTYGIGALPALLVLGGGVPPGLCAGLMMSSLPVGPAWGDRTVRPSGAVGLRAAVVSVGAYYAARLVALFYGPAREGSWPFSLAFEGIPTPTADPTGTLPQETIVSLFLLVPAAAGGFIAGYVGYAVGEHLAN